MNRKSVLRRLDMDSVGKRLRALVSVQYDSLGSFADRVGVTRGSFYRIMCGKATPDLQTVVDICALLCCSVDFLLGLSDPESDAEEGYETALLNIREFREDWTREQKAFLASASLGSLTEQEERTLRSRLLP